MNFRYFLGVRKVLGLRGLVCKGNKDNRPEPLGEVELLEELENEELDEEKLLLENEELLLLKLELQLENEELEEEKLLEEDDTDASSSGN